MTEGRATPVMVGERVAIRQDNAVTAPDEPAIDLEDLLLCYRIAALEADIAVTEVGLGTI